jgi:hypothetical protein
MKFSIGPGFFGCGIGDRRIALDDKFTATWDQPLNEGQTIIRGAATLNDNLRLANNVEPSEDRLWYEPAQSLWCEDENGVLYYQGTDFELGPGRIIRCTGRQPKVGRKYVIKNTA